MFNYSNRTALVTGASRGIGKEIASILAKNGIKVIGVATSEKSLESINNMENIIPLSCDISNEQSVENLYNSIKEHSDNIDILVNNAGILRDRSLLKMTDEEFDSVWNIHVKGTFWCSQYAALKMKESGGGGSIINTTSGAHFGNFGQTNYAAAKAGIIGFTKSLAREVLSLIHI